MERIAPLRLAGSWDNVGLLLESPVQRPAKQRILLTIDLTTAVLSEALTDGTSIIVSYHPPIFKGLQSFTLSNPLQASLLQCAAQGISVYTPHTALDSVWGGVNDWLAEGVLGNDSEAGTVKSLVGGTTRADMIDDGGEGRLVILNTSIGMDALERRIKTHLNLSQIQVGYAAALSSSLARRSSSIRTIAVCAGSGGSMLLGKQADVYFTGEMSHHEVLAAVAAGKHVILCGHTNTERGYLPILASKLRRELQGGEYQGFGLTDWEVIVSENDRHPLQFV